MATALNTTIQSIPLKPGEVFTLPPGAKLISATDPTTLDSTCPLDEDLEKLECFVFVLGVGDNQGNDTKTWDADDSRIRGWSFNGTDYDDLDIGPNMSQGCFPESDIMTGLIPSAAKHGIFITKPQVTVNSGDGDNGCITYILVQTIKSIASKLSIKVRGLVRTDHTPELFAYYKARPYSDIAGQEHIPSCTLSSTSTIAS